MRKFRWGENSRPNQREFGFGCKLKATPEKRQSRTRQRLRSRSKILDGRISSPAHQLQGAHLSTPRLPYQGPVFGILDGSFMIHALADFRTQGLFSAFCTEVSCPVPLLTSVPKACFLCFGRKFSAQPAYRLPSSGPVFCISDGIFGHAKGQDFLPRPCA